MLFGTDPGGLAVHPKYLDTVPNVTWYDDEALWVTGTKVRVCVVVAGVAVAVAGAGAGAGAVLGVWCLVFG